MQLPNHAWRFEGIFKMKLQASEALHPESLQSKTPFARKIESPVKALGVLHGRRFGFAEAATNKPRGDLRQRAS
jgi:hypothetical protein